MPESRHVRMRRRYAASRFGEIHLRDLTADGEERQRPLMCLHPAPYSGLYFATIMPLLNENRRIIAPDYPGYGASSPPPFQPSIDDYALAMLDVASALGCDELDVLGFHTGCLVAAEMALRQRGEQTPCAIRSLILVDVPYFVGDERSEKLGSAAEPVTLDAALESVADRWHFNVTQRRNVMPLERSVNLFCDSLTDFSRAHWAFAAARDYPADERLQLVDLPCTVVATGSSLQTPTRAAAAVIPGSELVELPEITQAVFESGAATLATRLLQIAADD